MPSIRKPVVIENALFSVLSSEKLKNFTVIELRDAYVREGNAAHKHPIEARKFVYKQILRLQKLGILQKESSSANLRNSRYQLVADNANRLSLLAAKATEETTQISRPTTSKFDAGCISILRRELNTRKLDMLTQLGVYEEYQSLIQRYPQLKEALENDAQNAKDACTRLLGNVKVLESLLGGTSSCA